MGELICTRPMPAANNDECGRFSASTEIATNVPLDTDLLDENDHLNDEVERSFLLPMVINHKVY